MKAIEAVRRSPRDIERAWREYLDAIQPYVAMRVAADVPITRRLVFRRDGSGSMTLEKIYSPATQRLLDQIDAEIKNIAALYSLESPAEAGVTEAVTNVPGM